MKAADFSEETLKMFINAKANSTLIYSFIERLVYADFDKKEIKAFVEKEFGFGFASTINNIFNNI